MHAIKNNSSLHEQMKTWRHWLHQHPELALKEIKTSDFVAEKLSALGLKVHRGLAKTAVVASLEGRLGKGGSIGLRADMDALPIHEHNTFDHCSRHAGKMHACGHDGHTTMLLGAAAYLAEHPDFAGTVHFIFQPAEENIGGGQMMVEEGLFDLFPCDAVYGMHNWPGVSVGEFAVHNTAVMAGYEGVHIRVIGKGGHAAMPDQTIDPVLIAAQIISALQSVVSRNLSPFQSAVLSITRLEGSHASNVIPNEVNMQGTLRYFDEAIADFVKTRVQTLCESICAGFEATAKVEFEAGYPPTINTPEHADFCAQAAENVVPKTQVQRNLPPSMGAEDFAYMLKARPGAYIWIGNGEGQGGCMLHNERYDFNNDILALGASYWVALVQQGLEKK